MNLLQALVLGVIQGLTEFLPISSSGHLVIMQQLFGLEEQGAELLSFDLALHFGTLLSVIAVFYRDIGAMVLGFLRILRCPRPQTIKSDSGAALVFWVIVGTVPAAVIGIAFKDFFHTLFTNAISAAFFLLVTGAILWATRYVRRSEKQLKDLCWAEVLLVGMAQALAILPGISRSGATIATGLFRRWDRLLAARFSFLLAIPAILGGIVFELDSLSQWTQNQVAPLIVGTVAAALSGFVAIRWLLRVVQRGHLSYFSYYCWAVGGLALIWFLGDV